MSKQKSRRPVTFTKMYPLAATRNRLCVQAYHLLEANPDPAAAILAMVESGVPLAGAQFAVAGARTKRWQYALDIGKRRGMELTAKKFGVDGEDGG